MPLKELVRETTDVIERLCIEAALELTGDNRASAAEILGLSRQSLYVKLRRYGLGDLGSDADDDSGPSPASARNRVIVAHELCGCSKCGSAPVSYGCTIQFGRGARSAGLAEIAEIASRAVRHPDRQPELLIDRCGCPC